MRKETSEFGKGFIYNFILFSKHWWKHFDDLKTWREMREKNTQSFTDEDCLSLWFNGAGDHFYQFEIPKIFKNKKIGKELLSLQDRALHFRMNDCTEKEFNKFFEDLENVSMKIDKIIFNIKDIKAEWN